MSWSVAGKKRRISESGRLPADPGLAEVSAEQIADPQPVLDQHRPVESQVRAQGGQRRGRRLASELDRGRIAGDHPHQHEDDDRDHEQDGDELDQALGEVALHEGGRQGAGAWLPRPARVQSTWGASAAAPPRPPHRTDQWSCAQRIGSRPLSPARYPGGSGRPRALIWRFLTLLVAPHRTGHVCWRMAGTSVITSCAISL